MPTLTAPRPTFRNDHVDVASCPEPPRGIVDQLIREWPQLCASPANRRLLRRWQRRHPVLAGPTVLNELLLAIDAADRGSQDRMLHALVALAQQGHQMAGRTLLQAMLPKLTKMSRRRGQPFCDDDYQLVLGHFWDVVHTYPLRRTSSVAANLALGTLNRLTRERAAPRLEVPEPHDTLETKHPSEDPWHAAAGQLHPDMDLMELLAWALDRQILTTEQASLLARVYLPEPGQTSTDIATDMGITVGALRSRCCRIVPHLIRAVTEDLTTATEPQVTA